MPCLQMSLFTPQTYIYDNAYNDFTYNDNTYNDFTYNDFTYNDYL